MSLFSFNIFSRYDDDMAAKAKLNESQIAAYAERLKRAGAVRADFDAVLNDIIKDKGLASADVQTIAVRYRGGGKKPSSRQAAISVISTRFAEIARAKKNLGIAEKARPL